MEHDENKLDLEDRLFYRNMLGFSCFQRTFPEENHVAIQERVSDLSNVF